MFEGEMEMKKFLDEDFMLQGKTAQLLYNKFAKDMPVIDYHCHIDPKDIYEDRCYENITQVWLYGDHYKWRAMRACGIDEKYITGEASDYEKFCKYAEALESAIGNPLYHWSHMELKKYFGFDGVLSRKTADEVLALSSRILRDERLSVRQIISASNVEVICTTDDPADSLIWHQKLKESQYSVKVLPAWRPDKALNIEKADFTEYLHQLEDAAGCRIESVEALKQALLTRMDFFHRQGCSVSDHGLDYVPFMRCDDKELEQIFVKRLLNQPLMASEAEKYKTEMLIFLAEAYRQKDWVLQMHYGCARNNHTLQFNRLGPDTGYDSISNYTPSHKLVGLLDAINCEGGLGKTILYSLNPSDNAVIDSIIGSFQFKGESCNIQHGSAWWFNDHKTGMEAQMTSLANLGVLGKFIGMLTDSRSFLSYTRHDYFRRILCNLIGNWVDNGEFPYDEEILGKIIMGISHDNAKTYFNF